MKTIDVRSWTYRHLTIVTNRWLGILNLPEKDCGMWWVQAQVRLNRIRTYLECRTLR